MWLATCIVARASFGTRDAPETYEISCAVAVFSSSSCSLVIVEQSHAIPIARPTLHRTPRRPRPGRLRHRQRRCSRPVGQRRPLRRRNANHWRDSHQTTRTNSVGRFELTGIAAGRYNLRAVAAGFARFESPALDLATGARQTLDISLAIRTETDQVTVNDAAKVELDPASNAGAIVLRKEEIDALPDDRDDLATDLQALAGPAAGPNGGQIYIDGFTGGRLPSKQSIREIRINQNPFAAQFDRPGQGRIEIFTKPGADEFHGELVFVFGDAIFNSRNPFVAVKPDYQRRQWEGEITGPINKKTSFFFDFERRDVTENAFVNAVILDSAFNITPYSQSILTPLTGVELNAKIDRQLAKNHTLTFKYGHAGDSRDQQGVGGFSLPSRAYQTLTSEDQFQLVETGVINVHTVNETRFRFRRQNTDQSGGQAAPAITVLDAFSSGGSPVLNSFDHQNRYELQNYTSYVRGAHLLRAGGVMRGVGLDNRSMQNYSGTFTFTSLESYRQTLLGLQQGLSLDQIRALGGGPSQFSLSAGDPLAELRQFDFGFFAQDDWRIRPNLTISGGLRYEVQTHSSDRRDFGPRLGVAWAPGSPKGKSKNVLRGGFGIFYDRLPESLTLDALRQNGIRQRQFLIPNPNFYPTVPSPEALTGSAQPQTIRLTDARWSAPRLIQAAAGFDRQLAKGVTFSTNYLHSIGVRALRSRNINAPIPGSGLRPYGGVNGMYLYESSGNYRQDQWITNVNAKINAKVNLSGFYALGSAKSNTDGAGSFPSNQYDLSNEYGRAGFDVRHRLQFNGTVTPKWGLRFSPLLTLASGRPYNIITGTDLNGDGIYYDRPAGSDRNSGNGPGLIAVNLRLGKSFDIGETKKGATLSRLRSRSTPATPSTIRTWRPPTATSVLRCLAVPPRLPEARASQARGASTSR